MNKLYILVVITWLIVLSSLIYNVYDGYNTVITERHNKLNDINVKTEDVSPKNRYQ